VEDQAIDSFKKEFQTPNSERDGVPWGLGSVLEGLGKVIEKCAFVGKTRFNERVGMKGVADEDLTAED